MATTTLGTNTRDLVTDPYASKILDKKCIRLGTSEVLPINFETACKVLDNPNLIEAMQAEFVRSISKNGKVDFPIIGNGENRYYYTNEDGKRTDVHELYKQKTDDASYNYIVQASGKRGFGYYDVIIHLQIIDAGDAGIIYSVTVHAWPHSWLARTSHKIGLTRKYFRKNMKLISWLAREIATGLCEQEEIQATLSNIDAARPSK